MGLGGKTVKIMDAVSVAATVSSQWFGVRDQQELSLDVAWTGTPTGTLSLEQSFDGGTTARTVTDATFAANPAGSASNTQTNWHGLPGGAYRVKYTSSSGTGTMTVITRTR